MKPEDQLVHFLSKYEPAIAAQLQLALSKMRALVPGAVELVYDNYNALVVGFGPSERASEAALSLAVYPKWVTLFFLQGATLADPAKLLKGTGKQVRQYRLKSPEDLDDPAVQDLIARALQAGEPIDIRRGRYMVIKSISAKQRPRLPAQISKGKPKQ